jgi:hypothetical protein
LQWKNSDLVLHLCILCALLPLALVGCHKLRANSAENSPQDKSKRQMPGNRRRFAPHFATSLLPLSTWSRHLKTVPSYYGHVTTHMQISQVKGETQ